MRLSKGSNFIKVYITLYTSTPKWCKRGVNSKTNPEKETNATKYFFIKTVTFKVAVFVFYRKKKAHLESEPK